MAKSRSSSSKVSVSSIMANREEINEVETTKLIESRQSSDIKPVQTGKKISVAEIMANK